MKYRETVAKRRRQMAKLLKRDALLRRCLDGPCTSMERRDFTQELREIYDRRAEIMRELEIRKVSL